MSIITIAIDAMGGDLGYTIVVPAAIKILARHANLRLILVGDRPILEQQLRKRKVHEDERLIIYHASQVVEMDEKPSLALRYKKDSSMRVAINLVKSGEAQACVSAGNTGALMATARFVLKTLPGIDRPAIITSIPSRNEAGRVRMLDLGANIDSTGSMLLQFAVMGSVLTTALDGVDLPKVALLNVGEEEIKGNEQVKEASRLLNEVKEIHYVGYIEGDGIFKEDVDVVVCDGFVGNVALKSLEGMAKFIGRTIKEAFRRNFLTKLAAVVALFVLKPLMKKMDPAKFNGASLVGLCGIVVKSHGKTTVVGYERAIECAMLEVENNVPQLIEKEVARLLGHK